MTKMLRLGTLGHQSGSNLRCPNEPGMKMVEFETLQNWFSGQAEAASSSAESPHQLLPRSHYPYSCQTANHDYWSNILTQHECEVSLVPILTKKVKASSCST